MMVQKSWLSSNFDMKSQFLDVGPKILSKFDLVHQYYGCRGLMSKSDDKFASTQFGKKVLSRCQFRDSSMHGQFWLDTTRSRIVLWHHNGWKWNFAGISKTHLFN